MAKAHSTMRTIINVVAEYYGMTVPRLLAPNRRKEPVLARQMAMYLAYDKFGKSMPRIGFAMGGRDHTTVLHGIRVMRVLVAENREVQREAELLQGLVEGIMRGLHRHALTPTADIDAFEVARRVVARPVEAVNLSVAEIRAVCDMLAESLSGEAEAVEVAQAHVPIILAEPVPTKIMRISRAAATAYDELQSALHSGAERGARLKFEAALKDLSTLFQTQA